MAKDDRQIVHGIRVMIAREGHRIPQSRTFKAGDEDELAAAFTQTQLKEMFQRGDITGNWKSTMKTATK